MAWSFWYAPRSDSSIHDYSRCYDLKVHERRLASPGWWFLRSWAAAHSLEDWLSIGATGRKDTRRREIVARRKPVLIDWATRRKAWIVGESIWYRGSQACSYPRSCGSRTWGERSGWWCDGRERLVGVNTDKWLTPNVFEGHIRSILYLFVLVQNLILL